MCGIIGYTGNLDAEEVLLKGLSQLEYRGYDSAGIALENGNGDVTLYKQVGQVSNLKEVCQNAGIPSPTVESVIPDGQPMAGLQKRMPIRIRPERLR